jgi:hypothetical protein
MTRMEPRIRDEKQVSLLNLRSSFNLYFNHDDRRIIYWRTEGHMHASQ